MFSRLSNGTVLPLSSQCPVYWLMMWNSIIFSYIPETCWVNAHGSLVSTGWLGQSQTIIHSNMLFYRQSRCHPAAINWIDYIKCQQFSYMVLKTGQHETIISTASRNQIYRTIWISYIFSLNVCYFPQILSSTLTMTHSSYFACTYASFLQYDIRHIKINHIL